MFCYYSKNQDKRGMTLEEGLGLDIKTGVLLYYKTKIILIDYKKQSLHLFHLEICADYANFIFLIKLYEAIGFSFMIYNCLQSLSVA